MKYAKTNASHEAITRNIGEFDNQTGNVYETVAMLTKRANQIAVEEKRELSEKISDFVSAQGDALDEIYENREQIDIAKQYEMLPKPTLIATQEYIEGDIYFREPEKF